MPTDSTAVLILGAASLLGLVLIPLGLPGLWVIVLGILGYGWLTDFRTLSAGFIVLVVGLALSAEIGGCGQGGVGCGARPRGRGGGKDGSGGGDGGGGPVRRLAWVSHAPGAPLS